MDASVTSTNVSSEECTEVASVNADKLAKLEYAAQFFGFTPKSFSDGIYNAVLEYHHDYFQTMQKFLKEEFPQYVTEDQRKKAAEVILRQVEKGLERSYEKLETYLLTNILSIPEHVVLEEDQAHVQYPNAVEDVKHLEAEIAELKKKIRNASIFNAHLERRSADIEGVQAKYDSFAAELAEISKICEDAGVFNLKESMSFLNQKTQSLLACLERMEPKSPPGTQAKGPDKDEKLEFQAKKIKL